MFAFTISDKIKSEHRLMLSCGLKGPKAKSICGYFIVFSPLTFGNTVFVQEGWCTLLKVIKLWMVTYPNKIRIIRIKSNKLTKCSWGFCEWSLLAFPLCSLINASRWWINTENPVLAHAATQPLVAQHFSFWGMISFFYQLLFPGRGEGRRRTDSCSPDCVRVVCFLCRVAVHCVFCAT